MSISIQLNTRTGQSSDLSSLQVDQNWDRIKAAFAQAVTSAGTVSSVGLTMPSGFTVGGSPVTTSGTLAVTTTLTGFVKGNGSGFTAQALIHLLTDTDETLTVARGGTGAITLTGILVGNGTSAVTATAITQGAIFYGSAVGTLAALAKNASATRYLSNTGTSNNPAWAQIALATGVSGILPLANGGTAYAASSQQDLLNNISAASAATTGQLLTRNSGGNAVWETYVSGGVTSVNGLTGAVTLTVSNTSNPLEWSSGQLNIPTANTTTTGLLSAFDWNRFNASAIGAFTPGSVIFADGTGTLAQDNANFFWDDTNNRLGLGTTTPAEMLSLGRATAVLGKFSMAGSTSGKTIFTVPVAAGSYTFTFPGTPTNGYVLRTDASGTTSWYDIATTLAGYVPYTGATTNVNLGAHDFTLTGVIHGFGAEFIGSDVTADGLVSTQSVTAAQALISGTTGVFSGFVALLGLTSGTVNINAQAAAGTWDFYVPNAAPAGNGYLLSAETTGVSSWVSQASIVGAYLPLVGATYTTTTLNGLALTTSTLTSGNLVSLVSTSTAATANTQTVLSVATSGANGTTTQTTYAAKFSNTHTGTLSTNIASSFAASGGLSGNIGVYINVDNNVAGDYALYSIGTAPSLFTGNISSSRIIETGAVGISAGLLRFYGSSSSSTTLFTDATGSGLETAKNLKINPAGNGEWFFDVTTSNITHTTIATSGIGHTVTSDTITSGTLMSLISNGNAASGNTQTIFKILGSGTAAGQLTTSANISNTHTGASSINYALILNASGGDSNYALRTLGGNIQFNSSAWEYFTSNDSIDQIATHAGADMGYRIINSSTSGSQTLTLGAVGLTTYNSAYSGSVLTAPSTFLISSGFTTNLFTGNNPFTVYQGTTGTPIQRLSVTTSGTRLGLAGNNTGVLLFDGVTSGTATLTVGSAAGTPTLTLPTSTGTLALTSQLIFTADANGAAYGSPGVGTGIGIGAASLSNFKVNIVYTRASVDNGLLIEDNNNQGVFIEEQGIGFSYNRDADVRAYINLGGYHNGTTRYRSLDIYDGKNVLLLSIDAPTATIIIPSLAGVGSRTVVASATGVLSAP